MHFHYRVTFTWYIGCFLLLRRMTLWPWPFDLESVSCTVLLMSDPHTNFYYPMSEWVEFNAPLDTIQVISEAGYYPMTIGYWVTSTEYLITFPLSETVIAHAPCHVTSDRGQNSPHFWNPWPQFAYSLCHFHGATTKIKPFYRQKNSVFPLWRLQSLLRTRSVTWPVHRRSPKTTRNNFLTPNCLFTIQLLCVYQDD